MNKKKIVNKISGVSTMDSTWSFYLQNVGSIPARRTKDYSTYIASVEK